jgi:peptidoglycan/xylan/chitin deacetylase (PgdA/CDA1 family)
VGGPVSARRPARGRVTRAALGTATLVLLAAPFGAAWRLHADAATGTPALAAQHTLAGAPAAARTRALPAGLPGRAAPVVLTYHDISDAPRARRGRYAITPRAFAAQLAALRAAGYRTLTARQFVAYERGGPVPRRSVLITFDDGTHGLWVWADRLLARYRMHATSFLITGRVGHDRPYYLSWPEVRRMAASGRWDFQSHTDNAHRRVPVGPGRTGSLFASRRWDPATGRTESVAHFRARVAADLARSRHAITGHGLPRPELFAYPFSEGATRSGSDAAQLGYVRGLVRRDFAAAFTDWTARPTPPGRRSAGGRLYERLEVLGGTTPGALLRAVEARTPFGLRARPLADPARWADAGGATLPPDGFPFHRPAPAAPGTYRFAAYAPHATADWDGYTVAAALGGLGEGGGTAGVFAHVGGAAPVEVRVSHGRAQLLEGRAGGRVLAGRALPPGDRHTVRLTVRGTRAVAVVDGSARLAASLPGAAGAAGTGGIGLSASRPARGGWPEFAAVRVAEVRS